MTAATSLAKSVPGLVTGTLVALTLLFALLFDSWRIGIVVGIVSGIIVCASLMMLDVTREEVGTQR